MAKKVTPEMKMCLKMFCVQDVHHSFIALNEIHPMSLNRFIIERLTPQAPISIPGPVPFTSGLSSHRHVLESHSCVSLFIRSNSCSESVIEDLPSLPPPYLGPDFATVGPYPLSPHGSHWLSLRSLSPDSLPRSSS